MMSLSQGEEKYQQKDDNMFCFMKSNNVFQLYCKKYDLRGENLDEIGIK